MKKIITLVVICLILVWAQPIQAINLYRTDVSDKTDNSDDRNSLIKKIKLKEIESVGDDDVNNQKDDAPTSSLLIPKAADISKEVKKIKPKTDVSKENEIERKDLEGVIKLKDISTTTPLLVEELFASEKQYKMLDTENDLSLVFSVVDSKDNAEEKNNQILDDFIYLNLEQKVDQSILAKMKEIDTSLPDVLSEVDELGSLLINIEEKEGRLKYKLKPLPDKSLYKKDLSEREEIIKIPINKKTKFDLALKKFVVDEKEEYDYQALLGIKDDFYIGFDFQSDSLLKQVHLKALPKNDCLELYLNNNTDDKIELCEDFYLEDNSFYLVAGADKFKISSLLPEYIKQMKYTVKEKKSDMMSIKLKIKDGHPYYFIKIIEHKKFFNLIPFELKGELKFRADGDDNNKQVDVRYGIWGMLFKDNKYNITIQIGPNLEIKNVKLTPRSVHTKDKLTFTATIINSGNQSAGASYTSEKGPSRVAFNVFGQDLEVKSIDTGFFMSPGDEKQFAMDWNAILCDIPVTIVIDPDNIIEEINEDDNVWSYTVKCAPTDAPDLIVEDMSYIGEAKRVGRVNKVSYTVKNQGTQPSPEVNSMMKWDGYSSGRITPALAPGQSHTNVFSYQVDSCDGLKLELDVSDIVDEISEDNNSGFDTGNDCKNRPDLFVENVWWIANGFSFGSPVAGEKMKFKVNVKNTKSQYSPFNSACVNGFTAAVKINGQTIKNLNFGKIGCIPYASYSVPDYWLERAEFTYIPKCNGEKITIEVDPNDIISERKENNNSWSLDIVCTES